MDVLSNYLSWINSLYPKETADGYSYDINSYLEFIGKRYTGDEVFNAVLTSTQADVYAYIEYLKKEKGNSESAINRKLSALKNYYGYLYMNKLIKDNFTKEIKSLKKEDKENYILTEQQCLELLDNIKGKHQIRDTALIMLFLFGGMSVNETRVLKKSDIDDEFINVSSSGKNSRKVFQNEALKSILRRFLFEERNCVSKYVFSADGENPISKRTVHQIAVKHLKAAGLYRAGMTTETLRKTGAYLLHEYAGFNLDDMQRFLGQKNVTSLNNLLPELTIKKDANKVPIAKYRKE